MLLMMNWDSTVGIILRIADRAREQNDRKTMYNICVALIKEKNTNITQKHSQKAQQCFPKII